MDDIFVKLNFIWSQQKGTSSGDTIANPAFVAWNIVQCRNGTQLRLDLTEPNANGVIVAADIFLFEENLKQTFFSFRNKGNLAMGFTVEIFNSNTVKLWRDIGGGWENPVTSANPLTLSKSNP